METRTCWAQVKEDYCPNKAEEGSDYCEEHADLEEDEEEENGIRSVLIDEAEALSYPPARYDEVLGTYEVRFYDNGGMSLLARTKTLPEAVERAEHFERELTAGNLLTPDETIN